MKERRDWQNVRGAWYSGAGAAITTNTGNQAIDSASDIASAFTKIF